MKKYFLIVLLLVIGTFALSAASISGNVSFEDQPAHGSITANLVDGGIGYNAQVREGEFTIEDVEFGEYILMFHGMFGITMYYNGVFTPEEATLVLVDENNPDVDDINFELSGNPQPDPEPGYISGEINLEPNGMCPDVMILAFDEVPVNEDIMPVGVGQIWNNGQFEINLPLGTYYLKAEGWGIVPEYFDNVELPEDATAITLTEENPEFTEANFDLESDIPQTGDFSISGTIITEGDHWGCMIFAYNELPTENSMPYGHGMLDENGDYIIDIFEEGTYYVMVRSFSSDPIYYDNTTNPELATPIVISEDTPHVEGIDFDVNFNPPWDNYASISGEINCEGDGCFFDAMVFLYNELPLTEDIEPLEITSIWNNGRYHFNHLEYGTYYIKVEGFGFDTQYYDGVTDPTEATPIVLTEEAPDAEDINFDVDYNLPDPEAFTITGELINVPDVWGVSILAYDEAPTDNMFEPVGFGYITDAGNYVIDRLEAGTYYVEVRVFGFGTLYYDNVTDPALATPIVLTEENPHAESIDFDFTDIVTEGSGTLTGNLTNSNDEPIGGAIVWLHPDNDFGFPYMTDTDENGDFEFSNIIPGDYILKIHAWGYPMYFYDGAENWEDADYLTFVEDTEMDLDIVLEAIEMFEVTGVVTNLDTNEPIQGSLVFAMPRGNGPNGGCWEDGEMIAETDENGFYRLTLTEGEYILSAEYCDAMNCQVQFYDHQDNPMDADILTVDSDIDGINFDFSVEPVSTNSIQGQVTLNAEPPAGPVMVLALSEEAGFATVVTTDLEGFYSIENIPEGNYFVLAFGTETVPTFYPGTYLYEEAIIVNVTGSVTGIDIQLIPMTGQGLLSVDGFIYDNDGEPVANANVVLKDNQGNVVSAAQSNSEGYYIAHRMPDGEFDAVATKAYYESNEQSVFVNDDTSLDFTLTPETTTDSDDQSNLTFKRQLSNYPNPFNPKTSINFTIPEDSNVELEIFNVKGQRIITLVNEHKEAGNHSVTWEGRDDSNKPVPSGIYMYRLKNGNSSVSKKMILMK